MISSKITMIASNISSKVTLQSAFSPKSHRSIRVAKFSARADLGKQDLVKIVSEKTDLSAARAKDAVDAFLDTVINAVARGEKVSLQGFGSFEPTLRNARKGRNPQTGAEIDIAAKTVPSFKASQAFKDTVNTASRS